jgi:acetoin utilization protein AcuB
MGSPTIGHFMTRAPHTVGRDQSLEVAHRLMNEHRVRHLPVLESGRLVGVVSQRDLYFIETLRDVDPGQVTIAEAMSVDVFTVTPRTTVRKVAQEMAERKLGSAVVVDEDGKVVGVFTTTDALRALVEVIAGPC